MFSLSTSPGNAVHHLISFPVMTRTLMVKTVLLRNLSTSQVVKVKGIKLWWKRPESKGLWLALVANLCGELSPIIPRVLDFLISLSLNSSPRPVLGLGHSWGGDTHSWGPDPAGQDWPKVDLPERLGLEATRLSSDPHSTSQLCGLGQRL